VGVAAVRIHADVSHRIGRAQRIRIDGGRTRE